MHVDRGTRLPSLTLITFIRGARGRSIILHQHFKAARAGKPSQYILESKVAVRNVKHQ